MASKAKQQRYHFYRRQYERLPESVTSDEVVKMIRSQYGVVVRKQSHRVTLWGIFILDDFYIFPFDKNTGQVVTVLPKSSEYYDFLKHAFFKKLQVLNKDWCEKCGNPLTIDNVIVCKSCDQEICRSRLNDHYKLCVLSGGWKNVISQGKPLACNY